MRLLQRNKNGEYTFTKDFIGDDTIPPYAILSHTWKNDQEVTYQDIVNGTGKSKTGYGKIQFCGQQAKRDNIQYFWVDTCCINKFNAVELQESINSMFSWYHNAAKCYVYLSDVWKAKQQKDDGGIENVWEPAFRESRWFTRGWTLQELIAPHSVYFYSQEGYQLGDKTTLGRQICDVTGIAIRALQGTPLREFSVDERMSWATGRVTTRKEDRAYSLLGIFGIHMVLNYGEGEDSAFRRLRKKIGKLSRGAHKQQTFIQLDREDQECIRHLRLTDPHDDKRRIEETKGGLLKDSYSWILETANFQRWRDDQQSRILWIKGDPGKGKTMLLCGIINELRKMPLVNLSFFFCQGTDSRINSAIAVLRGLTFLLVNQQPSLASHLRKKYDQAGQSLFEDENAWIAISDIFTNIVLDLDQEMTDSKVTYLVVDAVDECIVDLPKLLDLIVYTSSLSNRVKWLFSSRNEVQIEQKLRSINDESRLSLELKQNGEQVSRAVDLYIDIKLSNLESLEDDNLRDRLRNVLRQKANGTFLWVALVVQELQRPESWDPLQVVEEAPTGLYELYDRMVGQIEKLKKSNSEICQLLLSTVSVAYRPLYLAEVGSLCGLSDPVSVLTRNTRIIVAMCGSFLTIRNNQVYLIHQSAKDYLNDKGRATILHSQSKSKIHYNVFSQSLKLMSSTLKRDMYDLVAPGFPIDKVKVPVNDPLAMMRYSCIHWVDHLDNAIFINKDTQYLESLKDASTTHKFLKEQYLHWLEALSLCKSMPAGVVAMMKLEALLKEIVDATMLKQLVQDAYRFIMYHKRGIETRPLQVYMSALLFSPKGSLIKRLFRHSEPTDIKIRPAVGDSWNACLLTLEGHTNVVRSVTFSHDSTRLASASVDFTVKIWDVSSGESLSTLEGHDHHVNSVAFSHDSQRLASASSDNTVKIWDVSNGECLSTLEGHSRTVHSVTFSYHSTHLAASASWDNTVKIWDVSSGECLSTFNGRANSVAFSHDSQRLASASSDNTVKIWDVSSGGCLSTLKIPSRFFYLAAFSHDLKWLVSASSGMVKIWDATSSKCLLTLGDHSHIVDSVCFSHDSSWLASGTNDNTIKIWDTGSGQCLSTLEGHSDFVNSVAFSHDSTLMASASADRTVKIWDTSSSGRRLSSLQGHSQFVKSVVFSPDSTLLVSASNDNTIKIWATSSGECLSTLQCHYSSVGFVNFSHNSRQFALSFQDGTVKIWDASSGECLLTLKGHLQRVNSVAFSHDSKLLASASSDNTVKLWNASSGECLSTLKGHRQSVNSVAFSHNSARLASASSDNTVKIWDVSSSECLSMFEGHSFIVGLVAFSSDSTRLASASGDNTIKIWDSSTGKCLVTLESYRYERHSCKISSVAFSHNSTQLASASRDNTVKIWDLGSGKCLSTLQVGQPLFNISFDTTSTYLLTESGSIMIGMRSAFNTAPTSHSRYPRYQGIGLSPDRAWITYDSKNLLWLPSEYRPLCSAVSGNKIGIGVGSGKVWICDIDPLFISTI